MGLLYEKFSRHIDEQFYKRYKTHPHDKLKLEEQNSGGKHAYEVIFILLASEKHDDILIIKNLEELKTKHAKYIKMDPPKDCDYIIINETKQKIYYIELKDTDSYTHQSIKDQLDAGEKWLHHLLFCSHLDDSYIEGWKKFNICVKYNGGRNSFFPLEADNVAGKQIFFVKGNEFSLGKFRL